MPLKKFLLLTLISLLSPLAALQKVILLPIINIDQDPNFTFLETSITDALKKRLREKLAFDELTEDKWTLIAEQNFILRTDFHTRTAAMNLGILANQDIVISGGFKFVNRNVAQNKVSIQVTLYLLDSKKKKVISVVELDLPADSQLFTGVTQIANRMEEEARKVIPTKEDAARLGLANTTEPFFSDWNIALKAGGAIYIGGYATDFTPQLPALESIVRAKLPKLKKQLISEVGFLFMNHILKDSSDSLLRSLGASSTTANYMLVLSLGYQLDLSAKFYLEPQIGGGYVIQTSSVTSGGIRSTLHNGFPLAKIGVTTGYRVNTIVDVSLSTNILAYLEGDIFTYVPILLAGVHYKF